MRSLGASIELEGGYVIAKALKGLTGAKVTLSKVSVGATHNALMAAVLARGETLIENAAREPEVADLANCLKKMGAKISGIGSSTLQVQGVDRLHGAEHTVIPDRIETGTYAMAAAMTNGDVVLTGPAPTSCKRCSKPCVRRHRDRGEAERPQSGVERRGPQPGFRGNKAFPRLSYRSAGSAYCSHVHGKRHSPRCGRLFSTIASCIFRS